MKKLITTVAAIALIAPAFASAQDRGEWRGRGGRGPGGGEVQSQGGAPQTAPQPSFDRGGDRGQAGFGPRGDFSGRGDPGWRARPAAPAAPEALQRSDRGAPGQGFQRPPRFDGRSTDNGPGRSAQGDNRFDRRGPDGRGPDNRGFGNRGYDNRGYDNRGQNDRRFDDGRRGFTDNRPFDRNFNDGRRFNDNRNYGRGGSYSYRGRTFDRFRAQPYRWPGGYRGAFNWRPRQILPSTFLLPNYFISNYADFGFGPPPYGYEWIRVGDDALLVDVYTGEILEVAPGVFYW